MADVEVTGELSFDIRILNVDKVKDTFKTVIDIGGKGNSSDGEYTDENVSDNENKVEGIIRANELRVTAPAMMECVYQYPEKEQFDAVLSDMMNQLTKIFVRAQDVIREESRRDPTRFRVVNKLDSSFFEKAFTQMSDEFRQFYNTTVPMYNRAADPCDNQEQIKEVWQKLLEHSQKTLERAGLLCVDEFLRTKSRADDSLAKQKLDQLAKRELSKTRLNLLDRLCDDFQMCYNELI
ncbi:uncharacterized protein LOC123694592 [Colias croceus]|uniref:uncharacterized protein LOC123694592 n=1 Tax=Colias crocea TaxID=72248 RepID=UPI001E27C09E|nr:uncharacterized protein LOC123694592 [Colias croceus]